MEEESKRLYIAFVTHSNGQNQFETMPFGIVNAAVGLPVES